MAKIKIPPFTKGKKQLEKDNVDWSRELSIVPRVNNIRSLIVRIHVERVIGILKQKFTILQGVLPISLIAGNDDKDSTIDKIVKVCCACVNLCPSVVSQE